MDHHLGQGISDRRYAMNVAVSAMPFWDEPKDTWIKIGSIVPGLEMMFGGPSDSEPGKQIEELEMLIAQEVSGIVVFSSAPHALAPTINKAIDRGIPVVTAFADIPSKRLAHIGTNQRELAGAIAQHVLDNHRPKTAARALILMGDERADDQNERRIGIKATLPRNFEVICKEDNYERAQAKEIVSAALKGGCAPQFIFGCNSQSALGAMEALKEARAPGEIVLTGWDTELAVLQEIKKRENGYVQATAVLYASYMVQLCFALLEADHFGYLYPDMLNTRELNLPAVPKSIQIPMKKVVSAQEVDEYLGKGEVAP